MSTPDFKAIADAARPYALELLTRWLPDGELAGFEFTARNPTRVDQSAGSFRVNVKSTAWSDFSTGDKGGDLISLAAFLFDLKMSQAAGCVAHAAGLESPSCDLPEHLAQTFALIDSEPVVLLEGEEESGLQPSDSDPSDSFLLGSKFHRLPDARWSYKDRAGRVVLVVCRWNEGPKKHILQATPFGGPDGNVIWRWRGMPGKRPLLDLPGLYDHPEAVGTLIVEGEKAAHAARSLVPSGWLVTTWPGGAKAVNKADWSPLLGRAVTMWPDNDTPGLCAADDIEAKLPQTRRFPLAAFRVLRTRKGLGEMPEGYDAADAVSEGITAADLAQLFNVDESGLTVVDMADLIANHPTMHKPVIHGLLRQGETCNVIGAPKTGKSWAVLNLAVSIATGREWLGFSCERGRVLVLDNELHPETLANRMNTVLTALQITPAQVRGRIGTVCLRGKLSGLDEIAKQLCMIPPGTWDVVVVDALYRALPKGSDENSNSDASALYNLLDQTAGRLGAAFVLIHHTSKGNQSSKEVTSVGSGAGAQSRAADTHLVLRPHADKGQVVLDAVARSWPQPAARVLSWNQNGCWQVEQGADPTRLAGTKDPADHTAASGVLLGILKDEPTAVAILKNVAKKRHVPWPHMEAALAEEESEGRAFSWQEDRKRVWARKPKATKPPSKTDAVKDYLELHPEAKTAEIAEQFDVDPSLVRAARKAVCA